MKTLRTFPGQRVALGHQGENLALTVIFSIGAWVDSYGPGTVHLAHMRNGDPEAYPVAVTQEGTEVSWEVSDADTAVDGYGKYELRYIVGETVVKSSVGETYVRKALQYGAEPPEPVQSWLDHVAEKEHELLEAADDAKEYSENASRSADSAASSAKDAADSAAEAKKAADKSGGVKTVNGQAPDENGNVQIAVSGGSGIDVTAQPGQMIRVKSVDENGKPTAWEAVPWGYTEGEMAEIFPETDMIEFTDPTFGKGWGYHAKAPNLTVGKTYTVIYNGVPYDCVCHPGEDTGVSIANGAFALGNFAAVGGEDTGEPFAMLIFPSVPQIALIDLSGATSVRVGIMVNGETIHPIPGKLLPKGVAYVEHGAAVGQTLRISAVDENGVPTAWESVDFPSGGSGGNVELDTTLTQSGKAADAKATGDALTVLEKKIYENSESAYSIFTGKTASFYGDSLTEVNQHYTKGYHKWISEILGLSSYNNYGVSGYKVVDVLNKVNSVNDTADIIFVMVGVNDVQFDTPLGTITGLETGTVYGNLNALCAKLREKYPTKLLVFITPAEQTNYPGTIGVSMHDIMKATKEVCERHSIVVYDCFTYSEICSENLSYWTTDRCHWNDKAHEMVGKNLAHFVRNTFRYIPGASQSTTTLNSITATFNQGNAVIYDTDTLDSLKQYLTVTAHYSNGTTATVTGYTLVGRLSEGTSTMAVSYGGKSATFTVEVTHNSESGGESGGSGTEDDTTGFVGKTFKMTGSRASGRYYFTALVAVDSDFAKGAAVKLNVSGSNAVNMTSTDNAAASYGDDSGACSNGSYTTEYASGGNSSCTVDSNGNVVVNAELTLKNTPTSQYLKVFYGLGVTIPASFTINQISVTVNGNEKEILDIGGFYSDEKCELVWNG